MGAHIMAGGAACVRPSWQAARHAADLENADGGAWRVWHADVAAGSCHEVLHSLQGGCPVRLRCREGRLCVHMGCGAGGGGGRCVERPGLAGGGSAHLHHFMLYVASLPQQGRQADICQAAGDGGAAVGGGDRPVALVW